jgi:hypothetical protein
VPHSEYKPRRVSHKQRTQATVRLPTIFETSAAYEHMATSGDRKVTVSSELHAEGAKPDAMAQLTAQIDHLRLDLGRVHDANRDSTEKMQNFRRAQDPNLYQTPS